MKINLKISYNKYDHYAQHQVDVNDKEKWWIGHPEPEDACIGRDLIDGHDLINAIKLGYEAGKNGEELEIEESSIEDFEAAD
jgi:hypothetical protein